MNSIGSTVDDEYFTASISDGALTATSAIQFTPNPTAANPTADVPSELVISYLDMFGHTKEFVLDITVKKN